VRQYAASLFIFRRDLRIDDNTALNRAIICSEGVLPCFVFDPRQIREHPYQSKPALRFMRQSLSELQGRFNDINAALAFYHDLPVEVIKQVFQQHRIQAVFVNRDYTPFSRMRDSELAQVCQKLNIDFHIVPDYLLVEPEQAVKSNGNPYQVFTAFYNNAKQFTIPLPEPLEMATFIKPDEKFIHDPLVNLEAETLMNDVVGGRKQALAILSSLEKQARYQDQRDYPALDATSKLSAHLKFGTCSVREAYYEITQQLGAEHPLLRQLYWRDFFTHIAFHYPHVFGKAFHHRYDNLAWDNNMELINHWREGMTGFPIVDAGMRELNSTGFMHNRVRMIVASFLTKDLHVSWRWGERYFAQQLVDYDPAVNNGNWQWAASTGCDAQPYFRIFNPWLQQQKFDPECEYIYRWIPELKGIPAKIIHNWHSKHTVGLYPAPIVEHSRESQIAKERYKQLTPLTP
jgi:deoxyribodipyrimidine photo-lyase